MSDKNSFGIQCGVCDGHFVREDGERVLCKTCDTHYHLKCVKVNDNVNAWNCKKCHGNLPKHQLIPPKAPKSLRSRSVQSLRSNQSEMELALQMFDEQERVRIQQVEERAQLLREKEKSMAEQHERQTELLRQKMQFIMEQSMECRSKSSSSSRRSSKSMNSKEKVANWMQSFGSIADKKDNKKVLISSHRIQNSTSVDINHLAANPNDPVDSSTFVQQQHFSNPRPPLVVDQQFTPLDVVAPAVENTFNEQQQQPEQQQPKPQQPLERQSKGNARTTEVAVQTPFTAPLIPNPTVQTTYGLTTLSKEQIAARHIVRDLPYFDGSPDKWSLFFSCYNRTTNICGFSNAENLERLSRSLKGSALEAVRNSLTFEDNVPRIIATLKMLFGRPDFVINDLLEKLRREGKPKPDNIESIIKYSLQVESITDTMRAGGLSEYLWNPQMLQEMIERLPTILKLEWASCKPSRACSIEEFSAWLSEKSTKCAGILTRAPVFTRSSELQSKKGFLNVHNSAKCPACENECKDLSECESFLKLDIKEKWSMIQSRKLCRTCLKPHSSRRCHLDQKCGVDGCERRHHKVLHRTNNANSEAGVHLHQDCNQVLYKIIPVTLFGNNKKINTFAFLDDGSSMTLMEDSLATDLDLSGAVESLCLSWTGDIKRTESSSRKVNLQIAMRGDCSKKFDIKARTVTSLNLPIQTVDMKYLAEQYTHLRNIPVKSYNNVQPRILIGIDHSKITLLKTIKSRNGDEPIAGRCKIGWMVFGPLCQQSANVFNIRKCSCNVEDPSYLDDLIRYYYTFESIGISTPKALPISANDERAMQIIQETSKYLGGRYEVGLLWKYDDVQVPSSYNMALRRLSCLEKQCIKTPDLRDIINDKIHEYVNKGYARRATQEDLNITKHWYLPIFVVYNPNKPGKLRLVWDAAATSNNISLNSLLLKGMESNVSLPGILQRFRERRVGITGDIKEMYHQVRITPRDQQFQRFLWRSNPNSDPDVYIMQVMTFGATCSPSCAQFIKDSNADRFVNEFPRAVESIKFNHYVDDMLDSVDTTEEAIQLCKEVSFIHKEGGFIIRNWVSNSDVVRSCLCEVSTEDEVRMKTADEPFTNKVLGMWWSSAKDTFFYSLQFNKSNEDVLKGKTIPTKREVLRLIMSIFDPLGLLSHRIIFGKIVMQKVWRHCVSWDDQIPQNLHESWLTWIRALEEIERIEIPRWYGVSSEIEETEIHTFSDASEDAYSAVVYLRLISGNGIRCVLVAAKSRVAPLKMISVPRLELQGAVLGCRLASTVLKEQRIYVNRRFFWTDSQTVINWIHSEHKRFKQFVACRVGELLETTKLDEWRWVCSKSNVADLSTKMKLPTQDNEDEWFNGPSFLREPMEKWPVTKVNKEPTEELRPQFVLHIRPISAVIQIERFSSWRKLLRSMCFVLRYVNNLKLKSKGHTLELGPLKSVEYKAAEIKLFIMSQTSCYSEEIALLRGGDRLGKTSSIYKDLPYLDDDDLLRARGRIDLANCADSLKRPILLPRKHDVTRLLLQFYHVKLLHRNHETAINEIRQKFVIPKLRRQFQSVVKNCQLCKNLAAVPTVPIMADLPAARVTTVSRPFSFIGIDYFGPIAVTFRRRTEKRWGVLITCLTTRAIHLEMAYSLTSASCIICIRNCINRRGKPHKIYSDNATNFKGASRELKEAVERLDKTTIAEHFTDAETEWCFIPPASPHMGGAWERMVRSVKVSLSHIFRTITPNDEILTSSLIEVENIINSRPLTYVPVSSEIDEALTPNHFLLGSSNGIKPLCSFEDKGYLHRENWRKVQHIADMFWKRWNIEYLPTIVRRPKWFETCKQIEVGDIVIVAGGDQPRNVWPKGIVLELHESQDGRIRSVTLQTSQGIYKRPVAKLAVLDVRSQEVGTSQEISEIPGGGVTNDSEPCKESAALGEKSTEKY